MGKVSATGSKRRESGRWGLRRGGMALVLAVPGLGGCALVDAPYQPPGYGAGKADTTVQEAQALCEAPAGVAAGSSTATPAIVFSSFAEAGTKLCKLGVGYSIQRNRVMSERLIFDVPAIGLGVAGIANGAFNGAKTATLALGLGSAGVAGTSLYFNPTTRVSAYNGASKALLCASAVSWQMDAVKIDDNIATTLANDIATATEMIAAGPTKTNTKDQIKDLMTSRDNATKALADFSAASGLLSGGPGQLQAFAIQVISGATDKVVTGTQNVDAVLSLIKTQAASVTSPTGMAKPAAAPRAATDRAAAAAAAKTPPPPPPTLAQLIAALNKGSNDANVQAKRVNDSWSGFAKCSSS